MFTAKAPGITAEIEHRIRRGIYYDKLPETPVLQADFKVAKQTVTKALRPLFQIGLLSVRNRRSGIQINLENLLKGTICIVNRENYCSISKKLISTIQRDGFAVKIIKFKNLGYVKSQMPDDVIGVLFLNSSLTVEMAEFLEGKKIPFVLTLVMPSYTNLNFVDYDPVYKIEGLLRTAISKGYRKIGIFYSERVEGAAENTRRFFLK